MPLDPYLLRPFGDRHAGQLRVVVGDTGQWPPASGHDSLKFARHQFFLHREDQDHVDVLSIRGEQQEKGFAVAEKAVGMQGLKVVEPRGVAFKDLIVIAHSSEWIFVGAVCLDQLPGWVLAASTRR